MKFQNLHLFAIAQFDCKTYHSKYYEYSPITTPCNISQYFPGCLKKAIMGWEVVIAGHLVLGGYFPDFPCEDYCIPARSLADVSQEHLAQVIEMQKVISGFY